MKIFMVSEEASSVTAKLLEGCVVQLVWKREHYVSGEGNMMLFSPDAENRMT